MPVKLALQAAQDGEKYDKCDLTDISFELLLKLFKFKSLFWSTLQLL